MTATLTWQHAPDKPIPWSRFLERAGRTSLQQAWAYGEAARALGRPVTRLVALSGNDVVAQAQGVGRRWGPLRLDHMAHGPVFAPELEDAARTDLLRQLAHRRRPWRWRFLVLTPDTLAPAPWRRVMSGVSTGWLTLPLDEAHLTGSWRTALRRAREADLKLKINHGGAALTWLLEHEDSQSRARGYAGLPGRFIKPLVEALPRGRDALVVRAEVGAYPVASVLMLRHGLSATYQIGYANHDGRERNAMNLVLWEALRRLAEDGVRHVDLGGLDTVSAAGVARFKLGLNPTVVTYPGSYA